MLNFKYLTRELSLCKRVLVHGCKRCLCVQSQEGATNKHHHGDRTKLEGDMYDDTPHIDAQREYDRYREQQDSEEQLIKKRILNAALHFVPKQGWTKQAITSGVEAEGFPPITHGLISKGPIELVHHFYESANQELDNKLRQDVDDVSQGITQKKKTSVFVRDAVESRLHLLVPYIHTWPQAMGLMSLPQNIPPSLQLLHYLVDDIWYHAGDRSTDFNYYTKRGSLAAVIKATELHMLQDRSEGYVETWDFLDRRIENLGTIGKTTRQVQGAVGSISNILLGACILARNVSGIGGQVR